MLIRNYGLFWKEKDVFWGTGGKAGRLLGVPAINLTAEPVDFREQAGIYVLYANYEMVYVGQAFVGWARPTLSSRLTAPVGCAHPTQ